MRFLGVKTDEVEQFFSSESNVYPCGFSGRSAFQTHVRIHKIMQHPIQIQETLGARMTSEIPHGLYPILNATVVPFDCIVVVFEPIFSASDGHAKTQFARPVKKFVERIAVILKTVAHENNQFACTGRLEPFPPVHVKNLSVTRGFHLA